jgi:hypothetical protein
MYLDPAPTRQHNRQPTSRREVRGRFPGRQLHLHQPARPRNWSTPSLPMTFLQMAIRRAENPDSGKTRSAAYRCSQIPPLAAELRLVSVACVLTTYSSVAIQLPQHRQVSANRCVGQTLTLKAKTRGALCFGRGGLVGKVSPLPSELQRQKLTPHSGVDVRGFTWASIEIEAGKYGKI